MTRNHSIEIIKVVNALATRSILVIPASREDANSINEIVSNMEGLKSFEEGQKDDRNCYILFAPPAASSYIDRGLIKRLLTVSSRSIGEEDLEVAAPPKLQPNRTTLLSFYLSGRAVEYYTEKLWRVNLISMSLRIFPKRSWAEQAAARAAAHLSLDAP